jgi:Trp operon repressor
VAPGRPQLVAGEMGKREAARRLGIGAATLARLLSTAD